VIREDGKINISISSGSIIRGILFIVLLLFLYYIRDIVVVVLAAVVIASAIEPAIKWFGKYKIKRLPATIFVYVFLILGLAAFFVFFIPSLIGQLLNFLNNVPSTINLSDFWNPLKDSSGLLSTSSFSLADAVGTLKGFISGTTGGAFQTASVIFGGALSLFLIIVLSFYLAVQDDGVGNFLRLVSPVKSHAYVTDLWRRSQLKIGHWLQGQLLLGVMIGVLVYLGLMILGVEHALLLAFIAALFELIPVFGPILSAIPAVIFAFGQTGVTEALLVAGLYLIIHQFENNLLYPLVVKKIVGISPILVILAIVIGLKLAGVLGAILAVPVAAALMEYIHDVEKGKHAPQNAHTAA
jgi:predicted PurR-regulated permease PerM